MPMYCRNCGSEIPDEAKLCTFCGTEAVKPKVQTNESVDPSEGHKLNEVQKSAIAGETSDALSAAAENECVQTADAAQAHPNTQAAAAQSETSNLKAAVAQNKKRSRRRMPMILLVALALALATSVAYAAYRVYTDVWVPYQAEQQQKAQAEKDAQDAQDAYNGIIKEYTEALSANVSSMSDAEGLTSSSFPHVNPEILFNMGMGYSASEESNSYRYAVKDVNGDGIPELFIGETSGGTGTIANTTVWDIWTYQNGETKRLEMGMRNMMFSLRENGLILTLGRGGVNIVGFNISSLKNSALHDVENEWEEASNDWNNIASLSEDRIEYHGSNQTSNSTGTVYYEETQNGSTIKTGYCTTDQFINMRDEFLSKYPEDTSVEWKTIPTN